MLNLRPITQTLSPRQKLSLILNQWDRDKLIGIGGTGFTEAIDREYARLFPSLTLNEVAPYRSHEELRMADARARGYRYYELAGEIFDLNGNRVCARSRLS